MKCAASINDTGSASGGIMNLKTKNILTAVVLIAIAVTIYVLAVIKAISQ